MNKMNEILDFWFHGISDETPIDSKALPFKKWFAKNQDLDREIRERFESDLTKAKEGVYKEWELSSLGRLALIILYDQFSRNMYRDSARMFENDPLALGLSLHTIEEEKDRELQLIERVFVYMPLMHAEDLNMQKLCIQCFSNLIAESKEKSPDHTNYFEYNLQYAIKHREIIERFNRFPHRNSLLERTSTAEELAFLKTPGSSF